MTRPIVVGLTIMMMVAGCLGNQAPESAPISLPPGPEAAFDEATGAVIGVVTDDSLAPMEGVDVAISKLGLVTRSAADGSFGFSFVPAGPAVISVGKAGYSGEGNGIELVKAIEVIAGDVIHVSFVIASTPAEVPYTLLFIRNGIVGCSAAIIIGTLTNCFFAGSSPFPANYTFRFEIPPAHEYIVTETLWPSSSAYMSVMLISHNESTETTMKSPAGLSPIRADLEPGRLYCCPSAGTIKGPVPPKAENFTLRTLNMYAGSFQQEANSTLAPACQFYGGADCRGIGVTVEQRFSQYVTAFVRHRPGDPEAYSAVPDG